jgi:hypothetical protein
VRIFVDMLSRMEDDRANMKDKREFKLPLNYGIVWVHMVSPIVTEVGRLQLEKFAEASALPALPETSSRCSKWIYHLYLKPYFKSSNR